MKTQRRGARKNPVAKFLRKFNKPKVHPDKTKYRRKPKKQEQDNGY